eukprot:SM000054S18060  [mRNA]  locus=s54:124222:127053:- [translate_table: standard]
MLCLITVSAYSDVLFKRLCYCTPCCKSGGGGSAINLAGDYGTLKVGGGRSTAAVVASAPVVAAASASGPWQLCGSSPHAWRAHGGGAAPQLDGEEHVGRYHAIIQRPGQDKPEVGPFPQLSVRHWRASYGSAVLPQVLDPGSPLAGALLSRLSELGSYLSTLSLSDVQCPYCQPSTAYRAFCKLCGSALFLYDPTWPELVHPFATAIDSDLPQAPEQTHLMLGSKASWVQPAIGSKDKQFDEYPEESIAQWHQRTGMEVPL